MSVYHHTQLSLNIYFNSIVNTHITLTLNYILRIDQRLAMLYYISIQIPCMFAIRRFNDARMETLSYSYARLIVTRACHNFIHYLLTAFGSCVRSVLWLPYNSVKLTSSFWHNSSPNWNNWANLAVARFRHCDRTATDQRAVMQRLSHFQLSVDAVIQVASSL